MNNLISTIFNTKPPFIKVTNEGFRVNDHLQRTIQFKIHDFAFIRKLFTNARMSCYSLDAVTSKDGRRCDLCSWNYTCNKIIRLMVMVQQQPEPIPAILDINDHSLEQAAAILEVIDPADLHTTPINATIKENTKRINIHFEIQK